MIGKNKGYKKSETMSVQRIVNGRMPVLLKVTSRRYLYGSRVLLRATISEVAKPQSSVAFKFKFNVKKEEAADTGRTTGFKWSSHSMPSKKVLEEQAQIVKQKEEEKKAATEKFIKENMVELNEPVEVRPTAKATATANAAANTAVTPKKKGKRRVLRPRKAVITLSPKAIYHLKALLDQPEPKLIRVGARNRGCSGLTYDLQYITEPGKFDEVVEQDGVKIVIDSKALFSIVGSEMDWVDDKLASKFVFKNPNSKGTCGCGESFMV